MEEINKLSPTSEEEALTILRSIQAFVPHPEELSMLTRICSVERKYRGVEADTVSAREIADLAYALYSSGISEEKKLIQKLRQRA